jgi:hypothetical protein
MAVVRGADGQSGRGGRGRAEIDDESTRHQSVTTVHGLRTIEGGDTRHGLWGEGFVTCDRAPLSRCVFRNSQRREGALGVTAGTKSRGTIVDIGVTTVL